MPKNRKNRLKPEYSVSEAKLFAQYILDRPISDRPWRCWLRICKVPRYAKAVTRQEAKDLFTLAVLRKAHPKTRYNLVDIRQKQQEGFSPARCLPPSPGDDHCCYGKHLPSILKKVLARKAALASLERNLHRWSREEGWLFSRTQPMTHEEVQRWIDYAADRYARVDYGSIPHRRRYASGA